MDEAINNLLSEIFQVPDSMITDDLAMNDVDAWDSLKHMELIVSLEQNFAVELSFDDIVAMKSVGQIKNVLRAKGVTG